MKLNTGAKEIQQVNPGGPDKQPKHQAPTISSIDKSLSQNHHRVWSPTHQRAIKEESKIANRDWVDYQACSLLQYINVKPDTIIKKNHKLEFSGTRVKYLDHEERAYKQKIWSYRISAKASKIAHSGASRGTRCLKVVLSLLQLAYFVNARSESPGEVMRACRLVGAFATRRCNTNHHLVCWLIYSKT